MKRLLHCSLRICTQMENIQAKKKKQGQKKVLQKEK